MFITLYILGKLGNPRKPRLFIRGNVFRWEA